MSADAPSSPVNSSLEMDLAESLLPVWAKESNAPDRLTRMVERYDRGENSQRRMPDRFSPRRGGGNRPDRSNERRPQREARSVPPLSGWNVQFLPVQRGIEGLARQIKANAKAYPLFELAFLVLEKPERFSVEFKRDSGPNLFQLVADGSLWLSENEAVAHAMAHHLDAFYRRDRVTVEPPKGSYPFVAQCGMSGLLLGPPNYHDYQSRIRQVHTERFSNMPFEAYKSRIRMVKDEESIQKWKEEQSSKDEFYPKESQEGIEAVKLSTLGDVERHFRQNHLPSAIVSILEKVIVPGEAALNASTPGACLFVRRALEELKRFPLPLAHILGHELSSRGLQIFKAHENITYVSVARPRYLNRTATPVAESLGRILDYLEEHSSTPRAEQWKALLNPKESSSQVAEAALAKDLLWLLHEGHVIDYAHRGLEAARQSAPRAARVSKG